MTDIVEQLRAARALIDTPEKLEFLRRIAKEAWFQSCVLHENLDSAGMVAGFDRAIAEAEASNE